MDAQYRGTVFTGETTIDDGIITVSGDTIIDISAASDIKIIGGALPDPTDLTLLPGFVDMHNHGGDRGAFPTGTFEDCVRAATFHRRHGSTTILASLVSAPPEHLLKQTALLANVAEAGEISGIHLEGPFINSCRCGAQDPQAIYPGDPALFARIVEKGRGFLKQITFAPETAHVTDLLDICAEFDIIASLGHTDADFETTSGVLEEAARRHVRVTATHLFNAMPALHHRNPGPVAALLLGAQRGLVAGLEIVADGTHLADATVDIAARFPGAFAITDAMEAAGMPDGEYILGSLTVTVTDGVARLSTSDGSQGAIAGGTSTLGEQFQRMLRRGWSLEQATTWVAVTPGRLLDPTGGTGTLKVGGKADVVALSATKERAFTLAGGTRLD